jgi:phosphoenolpyruvate carboxykinase (GTP)
VLPTRAALDLDGLEIDQTDLDLLLSVDPEIWRQEAALIPEHLELFGEHLPKELWEEYENLVERLG